MANGKASASAGWWTAGVIVLALLVSTGAWNPFPRLWEWVNRSSPLSTSGLVWQQRLGSGPKSVVFAGDVLMVEHRTSIEARSVATGAKLWDAEADWGAVAGGETDAVILTGKLLVKGYQVIDPNSGVVRRRDTAAVAVWTFRDGILDVRCDGTKDCTLAAWNPRGVDPLWTAQLPGIGNVLFADNPELLTPQPLTTERVNGDAAGPRMMSQLVGFEIDGRIHVVDTSDGQVFPRLEPDRQDRVVVAGGRVLWIDSTDRDGTCYFVVEGRDPATGAAAWRRVGLNLRTAEGGGCVQRRNPAGQDNVVLGVAPDQREVVVGTYDGRLLWHGAEGERVLAVDDFYSLVRPRDGKAVRGHRHDRADPLWTRSVHAKAGAAITPYAAVIVDRDPDRVIAIDPETGRELLNIKSSATVLAVGPRGLVVGDGREIGYAVFGGRPSTVPGHQPPPAPAPQGPTGEEPGSHPCGGPKEPDCPVGEK